MMEWSEHSKLHNIGRKLSVETRKKISKNNAKHFLGKHHSEESKKKLSDAHKGKYLSEKHKKSISAGSKKEKLPFRVIKRKRKEYAQGFIYKYRYHDKNRKRKEISSVNLNKLKEKVISKGLEWIEYDELVD